MIVEGKSFDSDLVLSLEEEDAYNAVDEIHDEIEDILSRIEDDIPSSRERSLVITKLQEADMWLEHVPLS